MSYNYYKAYQTVPDKETEEELLRLMRDGNEQEREFAREDLILGHRGLALHIAQRYIDTQIPLEDLQQEALYKLNLVIDAHDPSKGRISSHFFNVIGYHMQTEITKQRSMISFPEYLIPNIGKVKLIEQKLTDVLNKTITRDDLRNSDELKKYAKSVDITVDKLLYLWSASFPPRSLNAMISDTEIEFIDTIESEFNTESDIDAMGEWNFVLKQLTDEERMIFELKLIQELTYDEVAKHVPYGREAVRNRVKHVKAKVKRILKRERQIPK